MGYKRNRTIYKLVWPEGDPQHGLVVKVRSISIAKLIQLTELKDKVDGDGTPDVAAVQELFRMFAGALASWNLTDDEDVLVPCTYESVIEEDTDFVLKMIFKWMEAMVQVPLPLGLPSPGGRLFPEGSIPMETLSPSLTS